ncbi:MAG: protease inhibitor I42 family protein [Thermoleophilia bacterium]|nr:protease inhibitor I42 family protein [Thermoleophilia bacterium]
MEKRKWYRRGTGVIVFVSLVALVAAAAAGCGDSANAGGGPLKLGAADSGKSYTVKAGDTIEVVLPGNPTTGYAWTADLTGKAGEALEQVGEPAYVQDPAEDDMVGVGGQFTFTFKAKAAGQATLKLVYSRSFEDVEPLETFEVQITVE